MRCDCQRRFRAMMLVWALASGLDAWTGWCDSVCAAAEELPPSTPLSWREVKIQGRVPGGEVRDLAVGGTGAVWVGTNSGVYRWSDGSFRELNRGNGRLPDDHVYDFQMYGRGVFVATGGGVAWFDDLDLSSDPKRIDIWSTMAVSSLVAQDGRLWACLVEDKDVLIQSIPLDPGPGWPPGTPRTELARGAIRPRAILPGGPHRLLCRDSHFAWFWLKSDGSGLILGDGAGKVQAAMTFSGWSLRAENSTLRFRREVAGELATFPVEVGTGRVLLAPGNIRDRTWLVRRGEASELDLKTGRRVRTVSLPIAAMPTAFVEDHLGRLWVGTSRGLFVADPRRTIRLVTERDEPAVEKPSAGATREVEGTTGLGTVETRPPRPAGAFAADGRFWVGGDRRLDVFDRDGARNGSFKYKGTPLKPNTTPENRVSSALLVDRTVLATMTGGYYVGEGGELKNLDVELVAEGSSETPFLARLDVLRKLAEFYSRNTADAPANSIDEAELSRREGTGTLLDYLKSKLSPARIREFESRAFLEAGGTLLAGDDDDGLAVVRISGTRTAPSLSSGFEDGETADKVPAGPHVGSPNPDMRSREETLVVLRRTPGKVAWTAYRVPTRSPDIQGGSMVAGPSPGQFFAIGTDGEGRSFEEDRWKDLPPLKTRLSLLTHSPRGQEPALFAFSDRGIWEFRGNEWKKRDEVLQPYSNRWVLGLLPGEKTNDLLVGVNSRDRETSLVRLDANGNRHPVKIGPTDFSPYGSLFVGANGNSLIRGPSGVLRAATTGGLFREDKNDSWVHDSTLEKPPGSWSFPSCLLAQGEDLWIAMYNSSYEKANQYSGGIWLSRSGAPAKRLDNTPSTIQSLAYQPRRGSEEPRIWYAGVKVFGSLGLDGKEPLDLSKELDELMGLRKVQGASGWWNARVAADGDGVLVLSDGGLARFRMVNGRPVGSRVELPGWPADQADSQSWKVLTSLPDGRCVAAIEARGSARKPPSAGESPRGHLWLRGGSGSDRPFEKVADLPWTVRSCALARGEILLGGDDGDVYTLPDKGPPRLRYSLPGSPEGPLRGMTWSGADEGGLLVLCGNDALYRYGRDEGAAKRIGTLRAWKLSVTLGDGSVLLLRDDGVSRLRVDGGEIRESPVTCVMPSQPPPAQPKRFVTMAAVPGGLSAHGTPPAYLLADSFIFEYDPKDARFTAPIRIPEEFAEDTPSDLKLAVDGTGVWLGSAIGLWRHPLKAGGEEGAWNSWDESDGLPSRQITGLATLDENRVMVVTSSGYCLGRQVEDSWRFEKPPSEGRTPGSVSAAQLFHFGDEIVLAIGGAGGLDLMRRPEKSAFDGGGRRFEHFAARDGLIEDQVTGLAWDKKHKELWVVSPLGVSICQFMREESDGSLRLKARPRRIGHLEGLPEGRLGNVWVDAEGKGGWLWTRDASIPGAEHKADVLSRWDRPENDQITTDNITTSLPLAIPGVVSWVGPGDASGSLPRAAGIDSENHWNLLKLDDLARPTVTQSVSWFLGLQPVLSVKALDHGLSPSGKWVARYAIDRPPRADDTATWFWPPDLWKLWSDHDHVLVAEVTPDDRLPDGRSSDRHVVLAQIDHLPAWARVGRLVMLIGFPLACVLAPAWWLIRRRRRDERVKNKPMPYVAGPAVGDPEGFGVRRALLNSLRNSVAGSNLALVGEWRIGKTSLQLQLARQLESVEDPAYTFFPMFIDLHKLGDDAEARFFGLLGRSLFRKARERGVPDQILDQLDCREASGDHDATGGPGPDGEAGEGPPGDYSLDSLENDLHVLLKQWAQTSAPRAPRVVFQVDEISRFNFLSYGTLLQFRSLFITDPRVKAVLSGRSVDRSRDIAEDSPWWNFIGKEIEVEPLTPDDARSLLVKPVSGLFTYREDAIQKILARGEGKPLALQQMGRDILQYKYDHDLFGRPITLAEVTAALSERRASDGNGRAGQRDESTEREEAR